MKVEVEGRLATEHSETIQIVPAPGWRIVQLLQDGTIDIVPVACFCLCEDAGVVGREVHMMVTNGLTGLILQNGIDRVDIVLGPGQRVPFSIYIKSFRKKIENLLKKTGKPYPSK